MPRSAEGLKAAAEVAKQVIALSTGVLTVSITFFDKIQRNTTNPQVHCLFVWSWGLFVLTILCAVGTLQGITGSLDSLDQIENGEKPVPGSTPPPTPPGGKPVKVRKRLPSAYDPGVIIPGVPMVLCFVAAMALSAWAAALR